MPTFSLAVCVYPGVTALDFAGPTELLAQWSTYNRTTYPSLGPDANLPDLTINTTHLAFTLDPIRSTSGLLVTPEKTYKEVIGKEKFDIILIPGGMMTPKTAEPEFWEFLKEQVPQAKYVLTVCSGSWLLAASGFLNGLSATTNKMFYKVIVEDTKDLPVTWVPKARWVTSPDKRIWTSSGVTAGADMAAAFAEHLMGKEVGDQMAAWIELMRRGEDEDEYAVYHGLV